MNFVYAITKEKAFAVDSWVCHQLLIWDNLWVKSVSWKVL